MDHKGNLLIMNHSTFSLTDISLVNQNLTWIYVFVSLGYLLYCFSWRKLLVRKDLMHWLECRRKSFLGTFGFESQFPVQLCLPVPDFPIFLFPCHYFIEKKRIKMQKQQSCHNSFGTFELTEIGSSWLCLTAEKWFVLGKWMEQRKYWHTCLVCHISSSHSPLKLCVNTAFCQINVHVNFLGSCVPVLPMFTHQEVPT